MIRTPSTVVATTISHGWTMLATGHVVALMQTTMLSVLVKSATLIVWVFPSLTARWPDCIRNTLSCWNLQVQTPNATITTAFNEFNPQSSAAESHLPCFLPLPHPAESRLRPEPCRDGVDRALGRCSLNLPC